jgi:hypothetical protein
MGQEETRLKEQAGRFALVDGIPFKLPVFCANTPVFMAVFSINADRAAELLEGNEVHPFRLWNKGLLVVTVVNYLETSIGKYIEYSIAIACTQGKKPAPRLLPGIFSGLFGTGQYVFDLPVSTEISVKGGKGIWGMPKHQANLDFKVTDSKISAQYDLDGQLAFYAEIAHPGKAWFPIRTPASNYCAFRGMLFKSDIFFRGKAAFSMFKKGSGRVVIGSHPRVQALKSLEIGPDPIATAFIPSANGLLDDYTQSWFLSFPQPPAVVPQGMESVVNLGLGEVWLPPPTAPVPGVDAPAAVPMAGSQGEAA